MNRHIWSSLSALMILMLASGCGLLKDETAGETMQDNGYIIEEIKNCGVQEANDQAKLTLFDNQTNRLYGWSHITAGLKEFDGTKLTAVDYKVSAANSQTDPTCNNHSVFQTVLVKKYADWDRQHANGIEPQFLYEGITFGQVESIVLELKINGATSSLLTPAALTYFEEMNYAPTPANLDDFADNTILGLRINPETKNGSVIRSYLQNDFDDTVPERFKEMALSFAKVEILLKQ